MTDGPRTWLLISDKLGDNAQIEVLASALGWPVETRRVLMRPEWIKGKPRFRPTLDHLDLAASDPLEPPWPELIITIGRRPSMAALWVKGQSGGRTRLVLIGRPRKHFRCFDLIVATPQYDVPAAPNVLHLDAPLMDGRQIAADEAADLRRRHFDGLPRPLTAVLVGGPTKPYRMDAAVAHHLLAEVTRATGGAGGLYLTTSRRTPQPVVEALRAALPAHARLHAWSPDGDPHDNPYLALLACADRFVVTGDSTSMIIEVARLGRPLAIYPLPEDQGWRTRSQQLVSRLGAGLGRIGGPPLLLTLNAWGLSLFRRDLRALHARLHALGYACPLGEGFSAGGRRLPSEAERVAERVRALFAMDRDGPEAVETSGQKQSSRPPKPAANTSSDSDGLPRPSPAALPKRGPR